MLGGVRAGTSFCTYPIRYVLFRIAAELAQFVAGDDAAQGPVGHGARVDLEDERDLVGG